MRDRATKSAYDKGRYEHVRDAKIASAKRWYADNKVAKQAYDKQRRSVKNARRRADFAENPHKYNTPMERLKRRLKQYGLTVAEFEAMFEAQGRRCACCKTDKLKGNKGWCVDHDHASGLVRGILCGLCNTGIGALGDNVEGVRRAVEYLQRANKYAA
jgi:hypothetical protein